MTELQKAMVLLAIARDHLDQMKGIYGDEIEDPIEDVIDDIGNILVALERHSKWPNWEHEERRLEDQRREEQEREVQ